MKMLKMGTEDGSGGRARSTGDEASVERRRRDAIGGRETRRDATRSRFVLVGGGVLT